MPQVHRIAMNITGYMVLEDCCWRKCQFHNQYRISDTPACLVYPIAINANHANIHKRVRPLPLSNFLAFKKRYTGMPPTITGKRGWK